MKWLSSAASRWLTVALAAMAVATISTFSTASASPMQQPRTNAIVIDAAPSVVSHQGSSQSTARLVIAPVGRSLGFVESTQAMAESAGNMTRHPRNDFDELLEVLTIRPVYVHQTG